MSKPIVLYYMLGSAPCHAVIMLAKSINLELELIEVDLLAREQMKEEFLKVSSTELRSKSFQCDFFINR
jgi:glutathione S-transferase